MQTKKLVPHLIPNSIYFGAYVNKQPKATESNAKDNCTASNIYLRQDSLLFNQNHLQRIFCSTQMSQRLNGSIYQYLFVIACMRRESSF